MPTPSGGITWQDFQDEFGGSHPIGIDEYYGVAPGVPASGGITADDLRNKSASTDWEITQGTWDFGVGEMYGVRRASIGSPAFGSIAGVTDINGAEIEAFYRQTSDYTTTDYAYLWLAGNRPAGFFSSFVVDGGNNLTESAAVQRAVYNSSLGATYWSWVLSTAAPWDGSGVVIGRYT